MARFVGRSVTVLAAVLALLCAACLQARAEERIALVVGNGAYRNVAPLANPGNDARLVARTLQDAGFTVIGGGPQIDVTRVQLETLIRDFGRRLTADTTALFYYAGHGVQVAGHNYLVPVEANVASASDVKYELVDTEFILDEMTAAGSRLNLVLLDACRNNPFAARGLRSTGSGLAQVTAPSGTIIGYATQPGAVAVDGDGANSPYSAALARAIASPGTGVLDALNTVGVQVQRATAGRQLPWLALSPLGGQFQFTPTSRDTTAQPPAAPPVAPTVTGPAAPALDPRAAMPLPAQSVTIPAATEPDMRRMEVCPATYDGFPADGPALACGCTAEAATPGRASVFGDGVYENGSSLCLAARHAGVISGRGGPIVVTPAPTPPEDPPFPAILRNGLQSYGTRPSGASFRVAAPGASLPPLAPPSTPDMRVLEFCPRNWNEFPLDGPPLTCGCTPEAATPGRSAVYGDKVYSGLSSLCLAARHAGAVTGRGGRIVVTPTPTPSEEPPFPSVLRNGIQSYGDKGGGPSFRVASADPRPERVAPPVAGPVQDPIAATLRARGRVQVYVNFDTDKASLQPGAEPVLRDLLAALSDRPGLRVGLVGHTDAIGPAARNQDLSSRRAAAVAAWLAGHGIDPARLRSTGRGAAEPIADNGTEAGRALNRRVEVQALD